MKVNNTGVKSTAANALQLKDLEKNAKAGKSDSLDKALGLRDSANVKMSPEAHAFQKAKSIASNDSIDEAKVARLQSLIDQGKYKVDSAALADRLVDEHLQTGE